MEKVNGKMKLKRHVEIKKIVFVKKKNNNNKICCYQDLNFNVIPLNEIDSLN